VYFDPVVYLTSGPSYDPNKESTQKPSQQEEVNVALASNLNPFNIWKERRRLRGKRALQL
jgi:hypothetical protein